MSTVPSPDAKAVVRAAEALTTQVRRIADALTTPVVEAADAPATTRVSLATPCARCSHPYNWHVGGGCQFGNEANRCGCGTFGAGEQPAPMDPVHILGAKAPMSEQRFEEMQENAGVLHEWIDEQAQQAPAADEEQTMRWARRESLSILLSRADRGVLCSAEGRMIREHVEHEMREADTARAVARANLRHVRALVPDMDRLTRENEQLHAGRETWKGKAEEIEQDRDRIAAELEQLRAVLAYEHKRANDAIGREETAEQDAEEQRRRANIFETELRVLRTGLRAIGADPTQIQNLWAQISLRNRQWRDTKRELRLTRSMLEEEGGDVSLVDEMVSTVAKAEGEAREAQAAIERVRALRDPIAEALEQADYRQDMRRGDLADTVMPVVLAALDGTEQPTTEA